MVVPHGAEVVVVGNTSQESKGMYSPQGRQGATEQITPPVSTDAQKHVDGDSPKCSFMAAFETSDLPMHEGAAGGNSRAVSCLELSQLG